MKIFKQIASLILALALFFAVCTVALPVKVLAATDIVASGTCGDKVTWELDNAGTLTISGSGSMYDYAVFDLTPWYNSKIKNVIIENGVTSIGKYALSMLMKFNQISVTIPDSVTSIGAMAFENSNFTSITIPDNVTSIGMAAFSNCDKLPSITIPDSVTSIGSWAFSNCVSLTSITIPDGVTSIEPGTFANCKSLTSVSIPDSVTSIESYAFKNCTSLKDVYYGGTEYDREQLEIDDYNNANDALLNATWHYNVEQATNVIASGACGDNLTWTLDDAGTLTIRGSGEIRYYDDSESTTWYAQNENIQTVVIEDGITSIGMYAFSDNTMTSVILPDSVTVIDFYAFGYCRNLASITIPDSVTFIGGIAFGGCCSLTSITIPDCVTSIGVQAFIQCTGLTSVTIPNSLTYIGNGAFEQCENLKNVYYTGSKSGRGQMTIEDYNDSLLNATWHYDS